MDTVNSVGETARVRGELVTVNEVASDIEAGEGAMDLAAGLSVCQVAAFEVMTTGGTIAAAARAGNVARKTIYEWLEPGHRFGAAFEQWKNGMAETSRTRLLMIGETATVQIARAINQGDTRAALAVVKGMGLLSPPAVGASTAQSVAREKAAEAETAERAAEEKAASAAAFRDLVNVDGFATEMRVAERREGGAQILELK